MSDTIRTLAALQTLLANNTSHDISPQDLRDFLVSVRGVWTSYSPSVVGWSATPTIEAAYYRTGNMIHLRVFVIGTSNANNITIDLPVTAISGLTHGWYSIIGYAEDNGTPLSTPAMALIAPSGTVATCFKDASENVLWTTSGQKVVGFTCSYICVD
jgi:hypothetical protein